MNFFSENKSWVWLSPLLLITYFLFGEVSLILLFLFTLLIFLSKNKNIISIGIIVGYLAASNQVFPQYRFYISLFLTLSLISFFLKENGLNFKSYPKLPKEIIIFMLLLMFTLLLSTSFSQNPLVSLVVSIRMIVFLVIMYIFYANLYKLNNVYTYFNALIVVMIILGIYMIIDLFQLGIERFFARTVISDKDKLLASVGNTGITIYFIAISFLTVLFFNNKLRQKYLLIVLYILNIIFLILANSRGGIAAAILSTTFIIFSLNKRILLKIAIILTSMTFLIFIFFPGLIEIIDIYLRWHTIGDREAYWQIGLEVINDYPIFGIGPGLFSNYFFSYASSSHVNFFSLPGIETGSPHPHNFFLYFMSENGILGLLTAISFFYIFFLLVKKTLKLTKKKNKEHYLISIAITGSGIGIFFKGMIEVNGFLQYGFITTDLPFWLIYSLLIWIYQNNRNIKVKS